LLAFQFWLFSLSAVAVSVYPTRAPTYSNSAQDLDRILAPPRGRFRRSHCWYRMGGGAHSSVVRQYECLSKSSRRGRLRRSRHHGDLVANEDIPHGQSLYFQAAILWLNDRAGPCSGRQWHRSSVHVVLDLQGLHGTCESVESMIKSSMIKRRTTPSKPSILWEQHPQWSGSSG
jgi:hypothetical protein